MAKCLAEDHGGGVYDVEGAGVPGHGNQEAGVGGLVDFVRHARAFAACEQDVSLFKFKVAIASGAFGGEEDDAAPGCGFGEFFPGIMAGCFHPVDVIHAGLADFALVPRKAAGLNNMQGCARTGAEPHGGPDILGDVRLVEGEGDHVGKLLGVKK